MAVQRSVGGRIGMSLVVAMIVVFCLAPVGLLVLTSIKSPADLSSTGFWPRQPTVSNFVEVFGNSTFLRGLLNSGIVVSVSTLIAIVFGALGAYALARLQFRGKVAILLLSLSVITFPGIAIVTPLFRIWLDVGLYDTRIGLIIPYVALVVPLVLFILTSFFREIPAEIFEAAYLDGASRARVLRDMFLPLSGPGIASAGLLVFVILWHEFLLAVTLTATPAGRTAPVALSLFTGRTNVLEVPTGAIAAASIVITVPIIVVVLVFQRRIVSGLTTGSTAG